MVTKTNSRMVERVVSTVNVRDFGAVGDGVADDTAAIQAAINSSGGDIVTLPKGTFRLTDTIDMTPCGGLVGAGKDLTVLQADGALATTPTLLRFQPDESTWLTFVGNVSVPISEVGESSFTLPQATTLKHGDEITIWDDRTSSWSTSRDYYKRGEMLTVDSVSGTTVNTMEVLQDAYPDTSNLKIYKRTGKSFKLKGMSIMSQVIDGVHEFGVSILGANGLEIDDIKGNTWGYTFINISRSRHISVTNVHADMTELPASGTNYCVAFGNCQDGVLSHCDLRSVRHAVTMGGGGADASAVTRNITVTSSTLVGTKAYGAADFHGNVSNCRYTDCFIDGGGTMGGHQNAYQDNIILAGNYVTGIYGTECVSVRHLITGNTFYATKSAGGRGGAIDFGGNTSTIAAHTVRDGVLTITDNKIIGNKLVTENQENVITLYNRGAVAKCNLSLKNNTHHTTEGNSAVVRFSINSSSGFTWNDVDISGNTLMGGVINLTRAVNVSCRDNLVDSKEIGSYNGILLQATESIDCTGNTVKNCNASGIYLSGEQATTQISAKANTVTNFAITGTGSVYRAGILVNYAKSALVDGNKCHSDGVQALYGVRCNGVIGELVEGSNDMVILGSRQQSVNRNSSGVVLSHISLAPAVRYSGSNPTGSITPSRYGEVYVNSSTDQAFIAVGLTNSDWKQITT